MTDILSELREACEYSDGSDGEESDIDSLIDYKDALEGLIYSAADRIKADIAFHAHESERLVRDVLDVDAPGDYSIADDAAESYHTGRVEAMSDAYALITGQERKLYSETEGGS